MKKKIVYIAHPIGDDVPGNIERLKVIYRLLTNEDEVTPFIPYMATVLSLDDSNIQERCIGFLHNLNIFRSGMVDEVWLYGNEISRGMATEVQWAKELGIPVVSKTEGTKCLQ